MHRSMRVTLMAYLVASLFFALPLWAYQAAPSSPPRPPTAQSSSAGYVAPLGDRERLQLLEYGLSEKVQNRVLQFFGFFVVPLAGLLGWLGFVTIADHVHRRVEKRIEGEVSKLRERLESNLLNLNIGVAECRSLEERSKAQSNEIDMHHRRVQELAVEYQRAFELTRSLKDMVTAATQGTPIAFNAYFDLATEGKIDGWNFPRGSLRFQIVDRTQGVIHEAVVPENCYRFWSVNVIAFSLTDDMSRELRDVMQRWNARRATQGAANPDAEDLSVSFLVDGEDGNVYRIRTFNLNELRATA